MEHRGIVYGRSGSGAPLVLLHGLGHRRQAWDPVLESLTGSYEVIAPDLPGFGESAPLADGRGYSIDALVDALADWFEGLGIERPHLAGNSLGGAVALELAARGSASSVTALSPIGFTRGAEMLGSKLLVGGMHVATRVPRRVWDTLLDSTPVRALTTLALHGRFRDPSGGMAQLDPSVVTAGSAYTALAPEVVKYSFGAGSSVACPATVAWGEDDRVLPVRAVQRVIGAIPHARQIRLLRCGHVPMENNPAAVAEVIRGTCRSFRDALPRTVGAPLAAGTLPAAA
ncbi:alpha/beta fold hydrolase [Nocardiopsis coralliicola]